MNFDTIIFGHITTGMAMAFLLGNLCLFLYVWSNKETSVSGYSSRRFLRNTPANMLFHIVSSFLVLIVLHEISEVLIDRFFPELSGDKTYHMTLAGLTGMLGSVLVAWLLEKWARRRNQSDTNINHQDYGPKN